LCVKAESEGGIVSYCFYKHHMEAVCLRRVGTTQCQHTDCPVYMLAHIYTN